MKDLLSYRTQFDTVKHCHYLISNSLGVMPNSVKEATREYTDAWQNRGVRSWEESWWMLSRKVGDKLAAIMSAPADTVSMHPNVTSAQAVIQSCFDLDGSRNKIVMVQHEFPSLLYLYERWTDGRGKQEIIPCPDPVIIPTDKLLSAIDEQTLLVPISHVLFRSSYIVDIEAIVKRAHEVGALVVLDVFQSVGVIPFDLTALNVDFAVGGALKWLCGGPGACFLYVRPDLNDSLKPRFTGWSAHQNPFAFDSGPIAYTTGSYRFMSGTPVIPSLYTCQPGIDIVSEISVTAIRNRSLEMTDLIIELAKEQGWNITAPENRNQRGGTVAIDLPDAQAVATELIKRNFLVDYRPLSGVRVSPHFYNTDDEIKELIAEIRIIRQ